MASQIINEGGSNCVQLSNSQFMRKISIGSTWTTLRIALRLRFDTESNVTGTPRLHIGLCNFAGGSVGDATCNNYLGFQTNAATLVYGSGLLGASLPNGGDVWRVRHRFGANNTYYTPGNGNSANNTAFNSSAASTDKSAFIFQFTKTGSPNFVDTAYFRPDFFTLGAQNYSMTTAQMLSVAEAATMSFANYTTQTLAGTFSSETTNGFLDAVNISWDRTATTLIIDDLLVVRVA